LRLGSFDARRLFGGTGTHSHEVPSWSDILEGVTKI
jgi:hypothetical protein